MGERGQRPGALRRARGVAVRLSPAPAAGLLLLVLACSREAPAPAPMPPGPAVPPAAAAPTPVTALEPQIVYQPEGRRDPFRDVLDARMADEGEGIDYAGIKVAGIVWQRRGYTALLETADGLGHILRVNDPLGKTGRVRQITEETVVIDVRSKDFTGRSHTRTITLELKRDEKLLELVKKDGKQPATQQEEAPPEKKEGSQ